MAGGAGGRRLFGHALASYNGFEHRQLRIVAVFDSDPAKIGNRVSPSIVVEPVSAIGETLQRCQSRIGMIAVPAEAAQKVADTLVEAGIRSILALLRRSR